MPSKKLRDILISIFVIVWLLIFHYESARYFYLQPFFAKPLPKMKFLFPPAGWIMFYNVGDRSVFAEVLGGKNGHWQSIDPHEIIRNRFVGFDMVHRNVLSEVLNPEFKKGFCASLQRQFPEFDGFMVTAIEYPSLTKSRLQRYQAPVYQCP